MEPDERTQRGFTYPELFFAMAFAFFVMGTMFGMFDNGKLLKEMSYVVAGCIAAVCILFSLITRRIKPANENPQKTPWGLIILTLFLFAILFGMIIYIHDRQENPPEDYCQTVGSDKSEFSSLARAVVLETGKCVKNETGFHANGKAIFP